MDQPSPQRATPTVEIRPFSKGAAAAVGNAVIIDVCRAFTVAALALARGAAAIVMVDDLAGALALRTAGVGRYCLGERHGLKPSDFDFGNSPAEIAEQRFAGETLIQTTSNGTRGIVAAARARRVYAGAFITAEATVRALSADASQIVTLVPMGVEDRYPAAEDESCAEHLRNRLLGDEFPSPSMEALRRQMQLAGRLDAAHPDQLSEADLAHCFQLDATDFAVRILRRDGLLVAVAERTA